MLYNEIGFKNSIINVFSYSHSQIDSVYNYIVNQEEQHKKQTFTEEHIAFLEKFTISFDERSVFQELI
jgi:hypothetical protein